MRIIAVVGIRSQYIKIYSVQRMLQNISGLNNLQMIYVDAGQHYDYALANGFIDELGIHFDCRLNYIKMDPIYIFSEMIYKLYNHFKKFDSIEHVDYVMCFGDANTTMATAIAASKAGIALVHVEAGLRMGNINRGPEEANRIVADHLASRLFVSNKADYLNINNEGLSSKSVFSGDIIQDLVLDISKSHDLDFVPRYFNRCFQRYNKDDFIIASMHRKENIKEKNLAQLFKALELQTHNVLFIAHPSIINDINDLFYDRSKITIAHYVPYLDMLALIKRCQYMITDSGAFQREAYYLKKRCIIRQDKPFWEHLVDIGAHVAVGKTFNSINEGIASVESKLRDIYPSTDYFGDGNAVSIIFNTLIN